MRSLIWALICSLALSSCGAAFGPVLLPIDSTSNAFVSSSTLEESSALPPKTTTRNSHFVGSGVLIGLSLLAFIPGAFLYSMNGQATGELCPIGAAFAPCHWNTTAAYASTFALAGVGFSSSLIWLIVTATSNHDRSR